MTVTSGPSRRSRWLVILSLLLTTLMPALSQAVASARGEVAAWCQICRTSVGGFVSKPGDTLGRQQPRVPKWRATLLASYQLTPALYASYGLRYSGRQYATLNNSDPNGFAHQGFSKFFTTDVRVRFRVNTQWSVAARIDHLNNYRYSAFHPYSQRSINAELKFDL